MNDFTNTTQLQEFLPAVGAPLTMSSMEIAELTSKAHRNVMADIRAMLGVLKTQQTANASKTGQISGNRNSAGTDDERKMLGEINAPKSGAVTGHDEPAEFSARYQDAQGKSQPCFSLPKRECLILVSGYSVELRARIIDRWMELEDAAPKPTAIDYSDPRVILGVIDHMRVQLGEKDQVIADQSERLKKLDRIEGAAGSMCLTDAAKTLKKGPQELIRFMASRGWIYKRVGNAAWVGRSEKVGFGYLEHREHVYIDKEGFERVATRVLVTGKGLVRLSAMLEELVH